MMGNWNIWPFDYAFLYPNVFWLFFLLPILGYWWWKKEARIGRFAHTRSDQETSSYRSTAIPKLRKALIGLKLLVLTLLISALAGPYSWKDTDQLEDYKNGIDIVLAMDVSLSMFAKDFEPNRLEAAKRVAKDFVGNRSTDRIGLVVYAGEAYTACPNTLDYKILLEQIDKISGEYIDGGTAIGVGLGTAVARLRSDSLSAKVVILLTDGSNNAGDLTPEMAAELAVAKNVRVYTIGMGTNGEAASPVITPFGIRYENIPVVIDEVTLNAIAQKTGGKYFRATNEEKLADIYEEIELLEKKRFLDQVLEGEPPADPTPFLLWAVVLLVGTLVVERIYFAHV